MIELKKDSLLFWFPEVHPDAKLSIVFQRTLRIPDDGKDYPLPPGLGRFPLRHVDDFAQRVPAAWLERGGVMLPMYQSEALWLYFETGYRFSPYPFAIKIAAGKIDAVTGDEWTSEFRRDPQNYVVTPGQPWLDGYCVEKGVIRQFVAMPLGQGYTAEEQLTRQAEHGGIQILAAPMKREAYERYSERFRMTHMRGLSETSSVVRQRVATSFDMGLAPGGRMRQQIFSDPHRFEDWDFEHTSRCWVHLADSIAWRAITGEVAPTLPPTAAQYSSAGLPWFEYYAEGRKALAGSSKLAALKSIFQLGKEKREAPLPENESATPQHVIELRSGLGKDQVREGRF